MDKSFDLKHGIQPFWFWNGAMQDDEMRRQVIEMKNQGLTGFLIHPRQGLELPYLSKAFFDKVSFAVELAKENDMEVWLYDEFPYPSGISGGKVTLEHPEYACRELTKTCKDYIGGQTAKLYAPWGKLLCARAYRVVDDKCVWEDFIDLKEYVGSGYCQDVFQLSGLTQYNKKRYFQGELAQYLNWQVPQGEWRVYIYTEAVMKHFKYFEEFIDPLNPDAVACFLQTTHEQYKKHLGNEFGKTIKGIFTDEVTPFPPFRPWSPLLAELVKSQSGIDLLNYLPALSEDMGEITAQIRYTYWNVVTEQFIKSWDAQCYNWCEENNLLYIGEKPILRSKELKYTHVPGIDAGHQKFESTAALISAKYRANGKMVSSAAHFYKKPAALCEAFHSIGWGMTLQDAKWIFDWLTVTGIEWFITHAAYYETDALKKHDAPPSFFFQMPWWKNANQLSAYTKKLNDFLLQNKRTISVLLLDPVTSTWTENDDDAAKLRKDFAAFQNQLLRAGVDYYIMDPQLFAEGEIAAGETTVYQNCGDSFTLVVLPFMTNLETCAVKKLQEYVAAGGKTVAVGTVPFRNLESLEYEAWTSQAFSCNPQAVFDNYFAQSGKEVLQNNGDCHFFSGFESAVNSICNLQKQNKKWDIIAQGGDLLQIESVAKNGEYVLFLSNVAAESCTVQIGINGKCFVRILAGGESAFLNEAALEKAVSPHPVMQLDTAKQLPFKAQSPNKLRIGKWRMEVSDGQAAEVDSFPLIDQMEAAGIKIDINQRDFFGCPKELSFPKIKAKYTYSFLNTLEEKTQVFLIMEPHTLMGDWVLTLNGEKITRFDFVKQEVYLPSNLVATVTNMLKQGENCLQLELECDKSFGGIRNPLYLSGNFIVAWQNGLHVLEAQQNKGAINNLSACGLPYYAGTVEFKKQIPAQLKQDAVKNGGL